MEIHFCTDHIPDEYCIYTYRTLEKAINARVCSPIYTTQMCFLSTQLFEYGYRIFIHDKYDRDVYEIKLGENTRTDRIIKPEHNLFKLWQAGEFDRKEN